MIRMYTGIIDPVECTLPTVNDEDENVTVMSEEQGPKYETELKATETETPLKPWSMRSTYCVKMIGISGTNFQKKIRQIDTELKWIRRGN